MEQTIRDLLNRHGGLSVTADSLAADADLYANGLTSFASVQVMLALESQFGIEFPDHLMNRRCFASIAAIGQTIDDVLGTRQAA